MNEPIYNIPASLLSHYPHGRLIVRARQPATLPAVLADEDPDRVLAVQILSLDADSEALNAWAPGLPVELALGDPAAEFPLLYRHADLLDNHPARVVIPVRPGFAKAVKVAVALDFAVRLEVAQPDPERVEELAAVLEFYLRQPTVARPIEYFHGALLGFYHARPASLWVLLDQHPDCLRYITDDGGESLPGPLAGVEAGLAADAGLEVWIERVLAAADECRNCEFLRSCGGYFKWPRRDYDCAGVKRLFGELRDAAAELRRDLDSAPP